MPRQLRPIAPFITRPDFSPYTALPAQVDLDARNLPTAWGAKESELLDLSREDAADDLLFGDIVWRSVKGADHPAPAPVRAAFVFADFDEEDEEDDDRDVEDEEHEREELPGAADSR